MTKKILLHIGMHKTGSSSIQVALKAFDNGKVRYAQLGEVNHSIPLFTIFSERRFERRHFVRKGHTTAELQAIAADFEAKLDHELSMDRDLVILSAEDLSTLKSTSDVAAMKKRLEQYTTDIEVLAYVREPVGFSSSSFQQKVRVGYAQPTIPLPVYRERYEPFISVFGAEKISFVKFDPSQFLQGSVVNDFLDRAGIMQDSVDQVLANSTLSAAATRLLYLFNEEGPIAHGNPMAFAARKQMTIAVRRATQKGPNFNFPPELILADKTLQGDLTWLRDNTGIAFGTDIAPPLDMDEITQQVQAHMSVTEDDRAMLESFCRRKKIKVPSSASALMILTLMFYHEIYMLGQRQVG